MPKHNTWVIKLGGSLIGSPYLGAWLAAIAEVSQFKRVVIVPGGGVFADVVRTAQNTLKIDDVVAHEMALQGMRQFGLALMALGRPWCSPTLMCVPDIKASAVTHGACIWDPCDPHLARASLPRDWRVTSDSLSLWLCGELCNTALLLVKSTTPQFSTADISGLAAVKFVDDYFPVLRASVGVPGWWVERSHSQALSALVAGGQKQAQYIGQV